MHAWHVSLRAGGGAPQEVREVEREEEERRRGGVRDRAAGAEVKHGERHEDDDELPTKPATDACGRSASLARPSALAPPIPQTSRTLVPYPPPLFPY